MSAKRTFRWRREGSTLRITFPNGRSAAIYRPGIEAARLDGLIVAEERQ